MAAFIGRERELAALGSALGRAAEGGPARIVISADLGAGTSRLLDELAARLTDLSEIVVCRAVCRAPQSETPYAALGDALAETLAGVPDARLETIVGTAGHDLAALLPGLAPRLASAGIDLAPPPLDAAHQLGARVREALLGVLERLAGNGELCLIVEDIEHSDAGTRELLGALVRTSRRLPLALIVSLHPGEIGRGHPARAFAEQLAGAPDVERLNLVPLSDEQIASLAESALGERPTLAFLAALNEGSRGNPLLAEQLVAAHERLAGSRLSDPLEEIVDARLGQLEPAQIRVLRVLAVAHRPLSEAQLAQVTLADGHLPRNAAALVTNSGLVRKADGGTSISHELLAEAIEAALLPAQRQQIHAAVAALLTERPAEAAWHWARAGRVAEAAAAHRAAAAIAQRLEPGTTALGHLVAALELGADSLDDEEEIELLAEAAAAAAVAGSFRRAATLASQALERVAGGRVERLMSGRADAAARARAAALCRQLGEYRRASGDSEGAREAFEQALAVAPPGGIERAAALAALAQQLMIAGEFDESASRAEQARRIARAAGQEGLTELAHATDTAAVDAGYVGRIDTALAMLDEALESARAAGHLSEVMRCYANRTTLLDLALRREEALAVVKQGIAEATHNGLGLTYGAFLGGNAADILFQLGRWTEAELECRAATEFPPAGVAWFSPILYLGLVLVESRADEEAAQLVGRTLLQLQTVPAGQWSALVLRTAVSLALWRGELADAQAAAREGWQRVLEADDMSQVAAAAATVLEACAAAADHGRLAREFSLVAEATALANEVLPAAEQALARHPLPASVGARREAELYMATARGHAERVRGKTTPETWARLAEAWAHIPVPYQVAKARWWQAQAALPFRERRAEARRALREAWQISGELPAGPLRAALRDLAQRGRIVLPGDATAIAMETETDRELVAVGPGRPTGPAAGDRNAVSGVLAERFGSVQPASVAPFGLSPREFGVLLVLAEGRTNREIAERLFISERTVAVHVRRILAKLGVSGRVEAAGMAIRLGLLPDDPRLAAAAAPQPAAARH